MGKRVLKLVTVIYCFCYVIIATYPNFVDLYSSPRGQKVHVVSSSALVKLIVVHVCLYENKDIHAMKHAPKIMEIYELTTHRRMIFLGVIGLYYKKELLWMFHSLM